MLAGCPWPGPCTEMKWCKLLNNQSSKVELVIEIANQSNFRWTQVVHDCLLNGSMVTWVAAVSICINNKI